MANRFFYEGDFESEIVLSGDEMRHVKVMRTPIGETIELVNGKSCIAEAVLEKYENDAAIFKLIKLEQCEPNKTVCILAQGLTKMNHLDFIIEKGTELGANAFWLFPGELSEKITVSPNHMRRLRSLSIAAMKQCGRLDLPTIEMHPKLTEWRSLPYPALFGDVRPNAEKALPFPASLIFIGPEKGFSAGRSRVFRKAGRKRRTPSF